MERQDCFYQCNFLKNFFQLFPECTTIIFLGYKIRNNSIFFKLLSCFLSNDCNFTPLIVVGNVVKLREALNFFEEKPLFGKRYLVPKINSEPSRLAVMLRDKSTLASSPFFLRQAKKPSIPFTLVKTIQSFHFSLSSLQDLYTIFPT